MSDNTNPTRVFTNARAKVMFGTTHVGNAQSCNGDETRRLQPAKVLGKLFAQCRVTVDVDATVTVGKLTIIRERLPAGVFESDEEGIIFTQPIDLHIVDAKDANKVVFSVKECYPAGQNFSAAPGSIVMQTLRFEGQRIVRAE